MAELAFVRHHPGVSIVHRLDVRVKLVALLLFTIGIARADFGDLVLLGLVVMLGLVSARPTFARSAAGLLWWFGFLMLVFCARALTTDGTPLFSIGIFSVTREGVFGGLLFAGRLAVIGLLGLLMVISTRPIEIKAGVQWLLRPVPKFPSERVATMLSLILRFIPMIFEQARRTSAAIKARGIEQRRNPFYRVKHFALPFVRRLFEDADNLILAMQARCYRDRRTDPHLAFQVSDWVACVGLALLFLWVLL